MAYSEALAERVRDAIAVREGITERKMFGGIVWMVNGNMACGTLGENLMVRLDHEDAERALAEPHVGPMEFTGRSMRGFITVDSGGIADEAALGRWVDAAAAHAAALPAKPVKPAKR
jgi:TfoX/Sxy family transcriptional regulator of competence genes